MIKKIILLTSLLTCSYPSFNMYNDVNTNFSPVETSGQVTGGLTIPMISYALPFSSGKMKPATEKIIA